MHPHLISALVQPFYEHNSNYSMLWTMQGEARFMAMNSFLEHFALIGGFIMTALIAEHAKREGRYW